MYRFGASLLAVVLSVSGCTFTGSLVPSPPPSAAVPSTVPTQQPTPTPRRTPRATPRPQPTAPGGLQTLALGVRDRTPVAPQADVDAVVKGNTRFALDLYQRLRRTEDGNIAMGP